MPALDSLFKCAHLWFSSTFFHTTSSVGEIILPYMKMCCKRGKRICRFGDIFHKTMENKDINTELEARLTFLSTDDPEQIYGLIQKFPMFREMYEDIFQLCQNTERVMNMYSKELAQKFPNLLKWCVRKLFLYPFYPTCFFNVQAH